LADKCRESELQIILTTHSPYILDELPYEARAQIIQTEMGRSIVYGVSPEFAMTKMDDIPQYECDLYVEDKRSQMLLIEILIKHAKGELVLGCRLIPYGAASVGRALGIMNSQKRFPRPSCVFLDGDQAEQVGCIKLPGEDAPERVVFEQLRVRNWPGIAARTGRAHADVSDACNRSMSLTNHRDWIPTAATALVMGGDILWQALCAEWASACLTEEEAKRIVQPIEDAKLNAATGYVGPLTLNVSTTPADASGNPLLFEP
jgi:hypothetical protein